MSYIKHTFQLTILVLIALILGGLLTYWHGVSQPLSTDTTTYDLVVNKGEGPRAVAATLKRDGIVENDRIFLLHVLFSGARNKFYPGTYEIKRSDSIRSIVNTVASGKEKMDSITVIEGWSVNDIAEAIAKKTRVAATTFKAAAPVDTYEGYLFPDTYAFTPETTAADMVKTMQANFYKRTSALNLTRDQLIVASIVEREARKDEDRPMIAGIYLNRLKAGMPLEADPTVQYAKGSWAPITVADYHTVQSPYNTYLHAGLPPTPICNPGLKSIEATVNPTKHNYYYFFTTSSGQTIYSKTLAEHDANKAKYLK